MSTNTSNSTDIKSKIEKLLRLASNAGTEDEAALAASRAAELMTKYNIEHSQLNPDQEQKKPLEVIVYKFSIGRAVFPIHLASLRDAVRILYDVSVFWRKELLHGSKVVQFYCIGIPESCFAAEKTFEYFDTMVENMLLIRKHNSYIKGAKAANMYRKGASISIREKCSAHKESILAGISNSQQLMVITNQLIEKKEADLGIKKGKKTYFRIKDVNAFELGRQDGNTVQVGNSTMLKGQTA